MIVVFMTMFAWSMNLMKPIFKSLFVNLALSPVTTMKTFSFQCHFTVTKTSALPSNQCHKHVLFNVCTAFVNLSLSEEYVATS